MRYDYDVIFVGGGLSASLAAYRLKQLRPEISLLVIERGGVIGGNQTWVFHETEVERRALSWLKDLVTKGWDAYEVKFPGFERTLGGNVHAIRPEEFQRNVGIALGDSLIIGHEVRRIAPHGVVLSDGRDFSAKTVIDARGGFAPRAHMAGFQKYVALEVRLKEPHGVAQPILRDAQVAQSDGYRSVSVFPWDSVTLFIEDTHHSNSSALDTEAGREAVLQYANSKGWKVAEVKRVETKVTPIPFLADFAESDGVHQMNENGLPVWGTRAGCFHPTTGHSFADAVKMAEDICEIPVLSSEALVEKLVPKYQAIRKQRWFYYFLNRLLFSGAKPEERYLVLKRFYRLPEALIARFHCGNLSGWDYFLLLLGKPPVSPLTAWRCFRARPSLTA